MIRFLWTNSNAIFAGFVESAQVSNRCEINIYSAVQKMIDNKPVVPLVVGQVVEMQVLFFIVMIIPWIIDRRN